MYLQKLTDEQLIALKDLLYKQQAGYQKTLDRILLRFQEPLANSSEKQMNTLLLSYMEVGERQIRAAKKAGNIELELIFRANMEGITMDNKDFAELITQGTPVRVTEVPITDEDWKRGYVTNPKTGEKVDLAGHEGANTFSFIIEEEPK